MVTRESVSTTMSRFQVRELVCTYRPARDVEGRIVRASSLVLSDPRIAAHVLSPLVVDAVVEMVGVACLSTKHRLLAWHLLSRGTRDSTPVSIPDLFVPPCVTPGTTALIVVHNHPSGDPTPSPEDLLLTARICEAGEVLGFVLLDHLIVAAPHRYYSCRDAGLLGATPAGRARPSGPSGRPPGPVLPSRATTPCADPIR